MKKLTAAAIFLSLATSVFAQFEGVLTYDCTIKNKTLTTIYESKTKVLVEAKIYPMKAGIADIKEAKEQDPILFDFETKKSDPYWRQTPRYLHLGPRSGHQRP